MDAYYLESDQLTIMCPYIVISHEYFPKLKETEIQSSAVTLTDNRLIGNTWECQVLTPEICLGFITTSQHIPTYPNHQPDSSSNCSLLPSWSSRSFIQLGTQHGEINRQKHIQYNIHNRIEVGPKWVCVKIGYLKL